ncbi:MAG: hypothetical protein GY805_14655 [Chloroflexi bacterium]|nr:hypothetical protein [Chloroflexota bacterium]
MADSSDLKNRASSIRARIMRLLAIIFGGLVLGYAAIYLAAWATVNPESTFAKWIVFGSILLFVVFSVAHHFKLWLIIANAFRNDL